MHNNPLKQYFRRPAVYLRLPSGGKGYPEGALDIPETGELPVYPMTAIDEITTKTPDALYNGVAIVELIKSCVPNIKDPWYVTSEDLDSVLVAIKAASGGNDFEITSTCPNCSNESTYGINLTGILAELKAPDYTQLLDLGDLKVKFRPLNYKEINDTSLAQFEVEKMFRNIENAKDDMERNQLGEVALKGITDLTMDVLTKAVEYIETPEGIVGEKEYILDFLRNCDKNLYMKVRDYNVELRAKTEMKPLDIKCTECGNEYKQKFTLNTSDFFA